MNDIRNGLSNGRLGMILLLGTETMLFATFIGAYMVLRNAAFSWPPRGVPALELDLSSWNTALLLGSTILIWQRHLAWTLLAGIGFLALQAFEFHRLYAQGLTLQTGVYGAFFYSLITCHGFHVLGGLALIAVALKKPALAENAEMYWHFVAAVWLVLFAMLYIL